MPTKVFYRRSYRLGKRIKPQSAKAKGRRAVEWVQVTQWAKLKCREIKPSDPAIGYSKIEFWDTTHTELLDCWIIEDAEDYQQFKTDMDVIL